MVTQLQPVKASGFLNSGLSIDERGVLVRSGIVPLNDVFYPHWLARPSIFLPHGSYGSGKSVFIAQDLIEKCRSDKYFKCYYGRKVLDTVRGSCFETLCEVIEDLGLAHEFRFFNSPSSSMVITHIKTGNKFVPFGSDNPKKLKSIKDPTHIWCEEFDQFTQEDFAMLYPRLRTTKAKTQFIGSFNTAPCFETHWIRCLFFPDTVAPEHRAKMDVLEGVEVVKLFCNYVHNYFIDQADYFIRLKLASGGNSLLLDAIAAGAWGVTENKHPWLYSFDEELHVAEKLPILQRYPVYLAFDFNNDPFACTAWQFFPAKGTRHAFIHCVKEFTGAMKVEDMCAQIKAFFPGQILHITGDRNGNNEDLGRNQTLYQMISAYLQVPKKNIDTPNINLEHADSRILLNAMLYNYPNILISRAGCPSLIRQCKMAKVDIEKGASHLLKDRADNKNDEFDTMRYFFQTYFHQFVKDTYLRAKKR